MSMELPVIQPGRPRETQPPIFEKIGIVGLGLIGGSIAQAVRQLWPTSLVIAVDNKDVLETAMRMHAIDVAADAGPVARAFQASDPALERLFAFIRALGAEPRTMTVETHDRMLAYLSHLPQLTASALMQIVGDAVGQDGLGLSGRGLADTTRLPSTPPDIWKDIAATNADQTAP